MTKYMSLVAVIPAGVAVAYGEQVWPFLAAGVVTFSVGTLLQLVPGSKEQVGAREGFLVVALTWLVAAGFGSLPYLLSGEPQLSNPVEAYFEGMSGFTTTGASVLTDIDALPRSLLFWRQLTQWFGGMGIIVLALAVLPRLRVGGRQLLESELPGPEVESLSSRIRDTARRLWVLYVGLTLMAAVAYASVGWLGLDERMDAFNAVSHALTTLPTLMALVGLMFIGGSAGSTSGSVKVVRHLRTGRMLRRELDQTVHPELVSVVRLNRTAVDERTLRAIQTFILLYIGAFILGTVVLMLDAARTGLELCSKR